MSTSDQPASGHVYCRDGKRGRVWYMKWRDRTGQHHKRLGKDWAGKGKPPAGYFREKEAQAALSAVMVDAERGLAAQGRTGLRFRELAEEWYQRGAIERDWAFNTRATYRSALDGHLLPDFGALRPAS